MGSINIILIYKNIYISYIFFIILSDFLLISSKIIKIVYDNYYRFTIKIYTKHLLVMVLNNYYLKIYINAGKIYLDIFLSNIKYIKIF